MMAIPWSIPKQPKIAECGVMTDTDGVLWVLRPGDSWWGIAKPEDVAEFVKQQYLQGNG